jgi:hypothetical protein
MKPVSRRHSTASSGPNSMGTPRASSTSAAPHSEVTARLPCLATLAPAAAATSAAPEEMLKVSGPPPPVPTTSTSSSRSASVSGSGVTRSAHHLDKAGQLRRLFAARGQHGQQRRGLHLRHLAGENLFQHAGRLLAGQRRAILGQRLQQLLQEAISSMVTKRRPIQTISHSVVCPFFSGQDSIWIPLARSQLPGIPRGRSRIPKTTADWDGPYPT